MRAGGANAANAGADDESKPPAFQIIVLVSARVVKTREPRVPRIMI